MIGAGSVGFTRQLFRDIVSVPELSDTEFRFMDISEKHVEMAAALCKKMAKEFGIKATVKATTDRRKALDEADYVFSTVRVGGLEAFETDIEIPLKYGVDQCVGDTLGPGGIFYAQRTIPVLLGIASDMTELCPEALLMNYSNPMAMNCWALREASDIQAIGLCHGVQHSAHMIAKAFDVPADELDYIAAGINHQTWFIRLGHKGKDLTDSLLEAFEKDPEMAVHEPLRMDVLRRFGFWSTESNGHLSEYLPWYRKGGKAKDKYMDYSIWAGGETGGYLRACRESANYYEEHFEKWLNGEEDQMRLEDRSLEHGSYIIEALETGRAYRGCFNVGNTGLITNLPEGCTVELPCRVDSNGIHPEYVGDLPNACAVTCRVSVGVQELSVLAALTGDPDTLKLAVLHDPLTGAILNPDQVWSLCDEMLAAQAEWLPQYQ